MWPLKTPRFICNIVRKLAGQLLAHRNACQPPFVYQHLHHGLFALRTQIFSSILPTSPWCT